MMLRRSQGFTRLPKGSAAQKSKNLCSNIIITGNIIEHLLCEWHCPSILQELTHWFFYSPYMEHKIWLPPSYRLGHWGTERWNKKPTSQVNSGEFRPSGYKAWTLNQQSLAWKESLFLSLRKGHYLPKWNETGVVSDYLASFCGNSKDAPGWCVNRGHGLLTRFVPYRVAFEFTNHWWDFIF